MYVPGGAVRVRVRLGVRVRVRVRVWVRVWVRLGFGLGLGLVRAWRRGRECLEQQAREAATLASIDDSDARMLYPPIWRRQATRGLRTSFFGSNRGKDDTTPAVRRFAAPCSQDSVVELLS